MTAELVAESHRIARDLGRIVAQGPVASEVPLRLHSREIDGGGAPEFHPAFLRYLGNATVCTCGRPARCAPNCRWERDHVLGHLPECEPACGGYTHFRASNHRNHPNRLKRALRTVRQWNPKAYDLCYLIVALGYSFEAAMAKINDDNAQRGLPLRTSGEFAVLWVSAGSMLSTVF